MRNLIDRVPRETRAELDAAVAVLEQYGPAVCGALHVLQRATADANYAAEVPASLDPVELADATDDEMDAFEQGLGIHQGWAAAFTVADAVHRVGV